MTIESVARVETSLRAQAKQSMGPQRKSGLLRRFAPRNDVKSKYDSAISRRNVPEFCKIIRPEKTEGAGNAGRSMHPQPRVRNKTKHTSIVTTVTPVSPGIPRAMVYGLLRALPGDQACLTPSPALLIADLTPASGRQNDTTSPYASRPRSSRALPRPSHPAPRS